MISVEIGDNGYTFGDLPVQLPPEFSVPLNGSFSVSASITGDSGARPDDMSGTFTDASVRIVSATLTDPAGNTVPYRSESGTPYFGSQSYVPEPGTGLLFLGSVGLATMLRAVASKWLQRNQRH